MSESISPVSFQEIPYTWKVPGNYMEVKAVVSGNQVGPMPARQLLLGQMYASGQATPGATYTITAGTQANALFGVGSQLAKICWKFLKNNPYLPVDAIGVADATGSAAASGTITPTGTATAAGTLPIYVGGVRVPVAVNAGDNQVTIANNVVAALNAQNTTPGFEPLPSISAALTGSHTVTLTCLHGGTLGNHIDVRTCAQQGEMLPAGITCPVGGMSGGATPPTTTVAAALAGIAIWYTDVQFPWFDNANVGVFTTWLNSLYGAMVKQDAHGYMGYDGTYGTILTFAPNCKFLSVLPMQNPLTPPWEIGAALAGACSYWMAQDPGLQMRTVPLLGVTAPAGADQFTQTQKEALLLAGLSTYFVDSVGNVYLERVATTYRIDAFGAPNASWFDIMVPKVCTRVRYDWNNYIGALFPRNRLTNDGTLAAAYAPSTITPRVLSAAWTARSAVYEKNGWIQNSAVTAKNSTFVIDANDGNRVDARQQIQVMNNLMVLAGSLEFIYN